MREYTAVITIKVIASVMAESENDAEIYCRGTRQIDGPDGEAVEVYGQLPSLMRPQIIGLAAYSPVLVSATGFKARTFKEAAVEISPELELDCAPQPVVFPPRYPGLPQD